MRITYLYQYFKTRQMAGGTRTFEMARRLVARGHEVTVITTGGPAREDQRWRVTVEDGILVHWAKIEYSNAMSYGKRLRSFGEFAIAAARRAAQIPADIIYASSTPLTIAIPAVRAKRRLGVPLVFEVRDLWPEVPIAIGALRSPALIAAARWLEKYAYRNSARIVALSPGMKEGVARSGYPPGRVHVIPNSADIEMFNVPPAAGATWRRQHAELGAGPILLYAGTVGRVNGLGWLAKLAKAVGSIQPSIRILVVGAGGEWEHVRAEASELGVLGRNFFMLESVPKNVMPAIHSAATMCISCVIDLKALWHNSANKFFDALAAGKPIAINHRGWQADLIESSGAGLVLPVDDIEASARVLAAHILDPGWLQASAAAASRLAREQFDRGVLSQQLEHVLSLALAKSGTGVANERRRRSA